ncbi:hypothetical protein OFN20_32305, partial [Escherichia coli]|nr:hypothetical protein [Escherichia coli]
MAVKNLLRSISSSPENCGFKVAEISNTVWKTKKFQLSADGLPGRDFKALTTSACMREEHFLKPNDFGA